VPFVRRTMVSVTGTLAGNIGHQIGIPRLEVANAWTVRHKSDSGVASEFVKRLLMEHFADSEIGGVRCVSMIRAAMCRE